MSQHSPFSFYLFAGVMCFTVLASSSENVLASFLDLDFVNSKDVGASLRS